MADTENPIVTNTGRSKPSPRRSSVSAAPKSQRPKKTSAPRPVEAAPTAASVEPTDDQIREHLARRGLLAVEMPPVEAPRATPMQSLQKTLREAVALPEDENYGVVRLHVSPVHDYVKVQDDHQIFKGNNERGVDFYRGIGFRIVPITKVEEESAVLVHEDGTEEPIKKGIILMARHKSIGLQQAAADRKRNDPKRADPEDMSLQSSPGGHFFEERKAIKGKDLGESFDHDTIDPVRERQKAAQNVQRINQNPALKSAFEQAAEEVIQHGGGLLTDE